MKQKFYETTLVSYFIKNLLSKTPLPLFPIIENGQVMLKDCVYTFKNQIIKCTETGIFYSSRRSEQDLRYLLADNNLTIQSETVKDFLTIYISPKNSKNHKAVFEFTGDGITQQFPIETDKELERLVSSTLDGNPIKCYYNKRTKFIYVNEIPKKDSKLVFTFIYLNSVSSPLVVTDDLIRTKFYRAARYTIINDYYPEEFKPDITTKFISNTNYYDDDTHKFLGYYLRQLKNLYDINLMSLYNCYSGTVCNDFCISLTGDFINETYQSNKVLMIPARFNTDYTIYFNSDYPIKIKGVIYKDGLVKDYNKNIVSNLLIDTPKIINHSSFNSPFVVNIPNLNLIAKNTDNSSHSLTTIGTTNCDYKPVENNLQQYEPNLYIAIEVPKHSASTLVALEGNYLKHAKHYTCDISALKSDVLTNFLDKSMIGTPSLTKLYKNNKIKIQLDTGVQYPFSDKLILYLIRNTVDARDVNTNNISIIQKLSKSEPLSNKVWTNDIRYMLFNKYMNSNPENTDDILGFVDNDIEEFLRTSYKE